MTAPFKNILILLKKAGKPVCLGFGVSNAEEAKYVSQHADGVIVGSAIVKAFHESPEYARDFIKSLREAI